MPIFPPIPLIRQNLILKKLRQAGAVSPQTAVTLDEAGVVNPDGFRSITQKLQQKGVICKTPEGKFYLP